VEQWGAQDSLVLKAIALTLSDLPAIRSCRCHHLAGHGGAKKAVKDVLERLRPGDHVMRSDVHRFYASIDHYLLMEMIHESVPDRYVRSLLWQYLKRSVSYGETYRDMERGISLGCPLSPLMGALYLKRLDERIEATGLFYRRYMDDWVIIAPSRWKLKAAVRIVNQTLGELRIEKHPDKTYIGRACRGFDFLGYFIRPGVLAPAKITLQKHAEHIVRLYEQGADRDRIGQYVLRWSRWLRAQPLKTYLPLLITFSCVEEQRARPDRHQVISMWMVRGLGWGHWK